MYLNWVHYLLYSFGHLYTDHSCWKHHPHFIHISKSYNFLIQNAYILITIYLFNKFLVPSFIYNFLFLIMPAIAGQILLTFVFESIVVKDLLHFEFHFLLFSSFTFFASLAFTTWSIWTKCDICNYNSLM